MSAPGSIDEAGISNIPPGHKWKMEVPASSVGGSRKDMGSLALFLVANWYVNGETVLIDGGVCPIFYWSLLGLTFLRPF